ncbi:MgtC/SapB family protein, partial [Burkholderia cenocepacia]
MTLVCLADDEVKGAKVLSDALYERQLAAQGLRGEGVPDQTGRLKVTATVRVHPKDQEKLEQS